MVRSLVPLGEILKKITPDSRRSINDMWNHPSHIIMRPMFWSALLMSHFPIDVLFKNLWAASSSDIKKLIKTNILQVGWKPVVQCVYWSKMIKTSMFASEKTFFCHKNMLLSMDWFRGNLQETIVFSNHQIWFSCTIFPWTTSANHANSKLFPFFPPEKKKNNILLYLVGLYIYITHCFTKKIDPSFPTCLLLVQNQHKIRFLLGTFSCRFQSSSSRRFCSKTSRERSSQMIPGIEKTVIITRPGKLTIMRFYSDLMGFYSDLMGFYSDLMACYSDLMAFYSDLMGY